MGLDFYVRVRTYKWICHQVASGLLVSIVCENQTRCNLIIVDLLQLHQAFG